MQADLGTLTIEYETHGDPEDPTLLLVHGLGAQLIAWDDEFVQRFVERGYHVVRFDNRDIGLSTKIDMPDDMDVLTAILEALGGSPVDAPYLLSDMADDALGLLEVLEIERAHILGVSMGGMIVQQMAINAPHRIASMTSIMSTTGDPDVGQAEPDVLGLLMAPPPPGRDAIIDAAVAVSEAIASPGLFDEERARRLAAAAYDRSFYPEGTPQQGLAILASGSRTEALRSIDVPALVIHGDSDPLVHYSGGERTAEAIPNAEFILIEGMAHDIPELMWNRVITAVCEHTARVSTGS
jgi:pimeloyl-ACP methyl ester carboxylesterase